MNRTLTVMPRPVELSRTAARCWSLSIPGSVGAVSSSELEPTQWKIFGERLVDENPFIRLSIASVELPDGTKFEQYVMRMRRTATTVVLDDDEPVPPHEEHPIILGHSRLAVTLEIYTHEDRQAQREALGRISEALGHASELPASDDRDGRDG